MAVGVCGAVLALSLCVLAIALHLPRLRRSRSAERLAARVVHAARAAGVTLQAAGSPPGEGEGSTRGQTSGGGGADSSAAFHAGAVVQLQPLSLTCAKPCDAVARTCPATSTNSSASALAEEERIRQWRAPLAEGADSGGEGGGTHSP
jgi:hypothetical protein